MTYWKVLTSNLVDTNTNPILVLCNVRIFIVVCYSFSVLTCSLWQKCLLYLTNGGYGSWLSCAHFTTTNCKNKSCSVDSDWMQIRCKTVACAKHLIGMWGLIFNHALVFCSSYSLSTGPSCIVSSCHKLNPWSSFWQAVICTIVWELMLVGKDKFDGDNLLLNRIPLCSSNGIQILWQKNLSKQNIQSQFCGLYKSLVVLATYALTEGKRSVVVLLLSVFLICKYSGDCIAHLECGGRQKD